MDWTSLDCKKSADALQGRAVFHRVIPSCPKSTIERAIKAALRQLDHILDLKIIQLSLANKDDGTNVVITSTTLTLTEEQKQEINEAIDIGRLIALCIGQDEDPAEVFESTSYAKRTTKTSTITKSDDLVRSVSEVDVESSFQEMSMIEEAPRPHYVFYVIFVLIFTSGMAMVAHRNYGSEAERKFTPAVLIILLTNITLFTLEGCLCFSGKGRSAVLLFLMTDFTSVK